ncbi:hypothetical protein [Limosilactobacillus sp.]|uniref:hypothetical protein n=1 Tax=Limosilactobacillus sp. TaxID=2773925 RepID=UPI003F010A29
MKILWVCLIAIVLVAILYVIVHRILINRATIMLRRRAQQVTDAAVNDSLQRLLGWDKQVDSQLVADVWGKGVLAFEYHFPQDELGNLTKDRLDRALNEYAQAHHLAIEGNLTTFVVTDWWQYEQVHHIDVAYLLNESTQEYVADLKRIDH